MNNDFKDYHPVINFIYFVVVMVTTMFNNHPYILAISLSSGFIYSIMINKKKAIKFNILYMIPLLLITALINPAFNHEGATILTYFDNGNPLTLESIVYGVVSAIIFISVILWFSCYNAVMTSDKFIYLFGRIIPALSLVFSMALRFVPRYKNKIKEISIAQRCIGKGLADGNIRYRIKNGIKILSIMITWALENAIDTADSMKSRGYGLKGRTAFSIYQFNYRDRVVLIVLIILSITTVVGDLTSQFKVRYFPTIKYVKFTYVNFLFFTSYFMLCILPIAINIMEDMKWKHSKYKR